MPVPQPLLGPSQWPLRALCRRLTPDEIVWGYDGGQFKRSHDVSTRERFVTAASTAATRLDAMSLHDACCSSRHRAGNLGSWMILTSTGRTGQRRLSRG